MDAARARSAWSSLWPAIAAAAAIWTIIYRLVIGPLQDVEARLAKKQDELAQRVEHLSVFDCSTQEWRTAREHEIALLREDLADAYADREKKIDKLTTRMDAVEKQLDGRR